MWGDYLPEGCGRQVRKSREVSHPSIIICNEYRIDAKIIHPRVNSANNE